jgi:hypothetical protein
MILQCLEGNTVLLYHPYILLLPDDLPPKSEDLDPEGIFFCEKDPEGIEILPQKRDEFKVFTSSPPSNLLHATSNTASDSFQ